MEPITLQNSAPNISNVVFLPHMPERWGKFFVLPSRRIKLSSLELELKSLRKILNLPSLKYFWFSVIHSNSDVLSYFEFKYCVNNITLLEYFFFKVSSNFRIIAATLNSYSKELKLLLLIRFCKRNLKGMLLLSDQFVWNATIIQAFVWTVKDWFST